jgi:hypothetical protein
MDRVDDPSLSGELLLFRRIPPWPDNVTWSETGPRFSTANFKDRINELSVNIAAETTPDEVLEGHTEFGLIQFTAEQARAACGPNIKLCRCTEDPAKGHALICGKVTQGAAKRLQLAAVWVEGRWPARHPPEPPAGPTA